MGENRLWGAVLAGLLIVLGLWGPTSPAHAATSNVEVSADPTEEKTVTLTITGETEANRSLWVVVIPTTGSSCPGDEPFDILTAAYRETLIEEDPLAAGSYQRTATFTPEESGSYLACSYVAEGQRMTANAKVSKTIQVREPTAASSIGVSSGATEERPVTLTITGQTEVNRNLWVVVYPVTSTTGSSCPGNDPFDLLTAAYRETLIEEDPVPAGSYRRTATFTPEESGSYLVCSYVAEGVRVEANAKVSKTFEVRKPNVTSNVDVSADPAENKPVTLTITGQTEVNRNLWVVVYPVTSTTGSSCPGNDPFDLLTAAYRETLIDEDPVPAGSFRRTATFTPEESGSYLVCSYVAEGVRVEANARTGRAIEVRGGRALMSVVPEGAPQHLSKGYFSIEGVTEAAGELKVYIQNDSGPCPAEAASWHGSSLSEGHPVEAGGFDVRWSFVPHTVRVHRICAYLTDSSGHTLGAASADMPVERNPAFLPKLVTPNRKKGFDRPPTLRWKTGPGNDYLQLFRTKPKPSSRPISLKRRVVSYSGGKAGGRWSARFSRSFLYAYGRYWWRIVRQDPETGYQEISSPRMFIVASSSRRGRNR